MISIGVIGANPGNGHPFSFSAIINGYSSDALRRSGWGVIADYLDPTLDGRHADLPARVTHAWMPSELQLDDLVQSTFIEHRCNHPEEMIPAIDAVMILRDDWASHLDLAAPFLEAKVPIFVDKPLTLLESELRIFGAYAGLGRLMSCSGLRYSEALNELGPLVDKFGLGFSVVAVVPGTLEQYGIHVLEFLSAAGQTRLTPTIWEQRIIGSGVSYAFSTSAKQDVFLQCLPGIATPIRIRIEWDEAMWQYEFVNHFVSFRETICRFINQVSTGSDAISWEDTKQLMNTVIILTGEISES